MRRLCSGCVRDYQPTVEELVFWERMEGAPNAHFRTADGCNRCSGTGFVDRIGVYEVLDVNEEISERLVHDRPSSDAMRTIAVANGLITLRAESVRLVEEGATSILEVIRSVHTL